VASDENFAIGATVGGQKIGEQARVRFRSVEDEKHLRARVLAQLLEKEDVRGGTHDDSGRFREGRKKSDDDHPGRFERDRRNESQVRGIDVRGDPRERSQHAQVAQHRKPERELTLAGDEPRVAHLREGRAGTSPS
jgi:hypothetical protein